LGAGFDFPNAGLVLVGEVFVLVGEVFVLVRLVVGGR
jgi:hypothetical protein